MIMYDVLLMVILTTPSRLLVNLPTNLVVVSIALGSIHDWKILEVRSVH
jgi:hypothetical protein